MEIARHPMSKAAYRVHLMGMCVKVMRSVMFNLLMLAFGMAIGMGFTVMKMEKMLQYGDEIRSIALLKRILKNHNIHDKCVDECLIKMKAEKDEPLTRKATASSKLELTR